MKRLQIMRMVWVSAAALVIAAASIVLAREAGSMLAEFGVEMGPVVRFRLPLMFMSAGLLIFGVLVSAVSGLSSAMRWAIGGIPDLSPRGV